MNALKYLAFAAGVPAVLAAASVAGLPMLAGPLMVPLAIQAPESPATSSTVGS